MEQLFECQCGNARAADELTPCPKCHTRLCEVCAPFGAGVACLDCAATVPEDWCGKCQDIVPCDCCL